MKRLLANSLNTRQIRNLFKTNGCVDDPCRSCQTTLVGHQRFEPTRIALRFV